MSITNEITRPASVDLTAVATRVLEHLEEGWNIGSCAAFAEVFTEDCDFVEIRGGHHLGRVAVAEGHDGLYAFLYRDSTLSYRLDSAREVAPSCVVAVASATLDIPAGPAAGVKHSRATLVLVEQNGSWSVAAFHNTLVQDPA
jgi:uncharacterized protein (TIGR02246 family)